ncbi:DUF6520 family protein [Sinomicrobium sp. M5D2P9]
MKKFKIIMPVLVFVMAITLAFAIPVESENSSVAEISEFMQAEPTADVPGQGCKACTFVENCSGGSEVCRCDVIDFGEFDAREDNCGMVIKKRSVSH